MFSKIGRRVLPALLLALLLVVVACARTGGGGDTREAAGSPNPTATKDAPQAKTSGQPVNLTIVGFAPGTTIQMRAEAIGETLRKAAGYQVTVKTGQGLSTAVDSSQGKIDMFITLRPYMVTKGMLTRESPELVAKYREMLIIPTEEKTEHLIVLQEVGISSFTDIMQKKYPVKIGVGGAGGTVIAEKFFKVFGSSLADVEQWGGKVDRSNGGPQVAELMKDKVLDTHFVYGGIGSAYYEDLAATRKVKLLPVAGTEQELKQLQASMPYMYRRVIPGGSYTFSKEDVASVAFSEFLAVRPDLPDDIAYTITKAIWENVSLMADIYGGFKGVLQPEKAMEMLQSQADDIHPGARRYYQEKGWLR